MTRALIITDRDSHASLLLLNNVKTGYRKGSAENRWPGSAECLSRKCLFICETSSHEIDDSE